MREANYLGPLDNWLGIATHGLCAEARMRIVVEMHRHVEDAAMMLQAEGVRPDRARPKAVEQLGDPKVAGRKFRQSNWTGAEYRRLQRLAHPSRTDAIVSFPLVVVLVLLNLAIVTSNAKHILEGSPAAAVHNLYSALVFMIAFSLFPLGRLTARRHALRRGIAVTATAIALLTSHFVIALFSMDIIETRNVITETVALLVFPIWALRYLSLWRKLGWLAPPEFSENLYE